MILFSRDQKILFNLYWCKMCTAADLVGRNIPKTCCKMAVCLCFGSVGVAHKMLMSKKAYQDTCKILFKQFIENIF